TLYSERPAAFFAARAMTIPPRPGFGAHSRRLGGTACTPGPRYLSTAAGCLLEPLLEFLHGLVERLRGLALAFLVLRLAQRLDGARGFLGGIIEGVRRGDGEVRVNQGRVVLELTTLEVEGAGGVCRKVRPGPGSDWERVLP